MVALYTGLLFFTINCLINTTPSEAVIKMENDSTLSIQDFREIIEYSLQYSRCCNVFIESAEYRNETNGLGIEFIKIYTSNGTITKSTNNCKGYFLFGRDPDKLADIIQGIPEKNIQTEILVMTVVSLISNSRLLHTDLYGNANVNIVAPNKRWTLSENFFRDGQFREIFRNIDMIHNSRPIDLKRRQLQVATFYIPPLSYLSTSINQTVKGIEGEFFMTNETTEWDGVEVKLFLIMAEKLNSTFLMRKPNGGYRYGRASNGTWQGGMIGQLVREEIDLAFGGIWLQADAYKFVNLSVPWYHVSINFLVPRPKPIINIWALMRPLNPYVWLTIIFIFFLQSLNIWLKALINPSVPSRFKSYSSGFIELVGRLVGSAATKDIQGLRTQFHLWHIAGLLMVTFYCSSLAARLSTPDYEPRIDTRRQFLQRNLTWGREPPIPKFLDYFDQEIADEMRSRFRIEASEFERHRKMMEGNYAVTGRIIQSIFFPENSINPHDLPYYRVMKESFGKYYICFATQPWLAASIDTMILRLVEHGFTTYHLHNVIHRRTTISLREVLIEHDGQNIVPKALMLKPLSAGFILLFTGYSLSTMIFFFELYYGAICESRLLSKTKISMKVCQYLRRQRQKIHFH